MTIIVSNKNIISYKIVDQQTLDQQIKNRISNKISYLIWRVRITQRTAITHSKIREFSQFPTTHQ
jgi:hypothetical protein